jgi:competence protein ComEC
MIGGTIEHVEYRTAEQEIRLIIAQSAHKDMPPRLRITVKETLLPKADDLTVTAGQYVRLKARLMPPPRAALPGGYDFGQRAWFDRIGAVGTALSAPEFSGSENKARPLRDDLADHIRTRLNSDQAGIAVALATGDQGSIREADAEAMRQSGLAHLLSISGLHVTAMVAAVMFITLRLLALSTTLALHLPLVLLAAGAGALAGIGYTWLTGAQVPTVRSCIAALLVLFAILLGREAITMRLLAAGAIIVLLLKPESLFGPSFQLSFAAIAAIMAVHEHPRMRALLMRRDEGWLWGTARSLLGLLLTGLAVEIALMPIALFHFHKAGIYGSLANMVAIPLTTFIIMPLEAIALLFDAIVPGAALGTPFWWLCGQSLQFLLWLAHSVAGLPGAVAFVPGMGPLPFALMIAGGAWFFIWNSRQRFWGFALILTSLLLMLSAPQEDLFITQDGKHVATRMPDGRFALLRGRAGDFVRDALSEASGSDEDMAKLDQSRSAECSLDFCVWTVTGDGGHTLRILASRSNERADWQAVVNACAAVDIAISDRWLPRSCTPKWLKADRKLLAETGGLAIDIDTGTMRQSRNKDSSLPWDNPVQIVPTQMPRAAMSDLDLTRKPVAQ